MPFWVYSLIRILQCKREGMKMAKSFAQKLSDARLMVAGIKSHKDELAGVTLGEEQVAAIETLLNKISELDTQQEKLKAELKTCTVELDKQTKDLDDALKDAKKRVKLTIPQSMWQEFGISDKK